jgi:hypothetical protein
MTNAIKVFKREVSDGVAEAVKAQASIAYCTQATEFIQPTGIVDQKLSNFAHKVIAENKDQIDLFYLESVLVSTGWNKNDDVFLREPTWAARNTPEDKQFNFMHNENDIIGHITGSYVLDKDGKRVTAAEEAPQQFDIITQAVIYNSWSDPENKARMEQILAEIKAGKWFVSMECLFAGFDYAITDDKGKASLVERNEASAFLTKHLRSYGGTGEYEGYKVGRALRSIAFSGKGLVAKPANPRSVIFANKSVAAFNADDKDIKKTFSGEKKMADENKQLEQAFADLKAAREEAKAFKLEWEAAKAKEIADKVKAFESTIAAKDTEITALKASIKVGEDAVKATEAKVVAETAKVTVAEEATKAVQTKLDEANKTIADAAKAAKTVARKAALVKAGIEADKIDAFIKNFEELPDAAFDSVVAAFPPAKDGKSKEEKEENKKGEASATTPEITEGLETSEASLVEGEEEDEAAKTRASIADWFTKNAMGADKVTAHDAKTATKKK